jgi:hypothetical protein
VCWSRETTPHRPRDADIKVTGPFAAATVSGSVAMTNSHILKNIVSSQSACQADQRPNRHRSVRNFLPGPATRDWKSMSQLKQKIRADSGNLATGGAIADIKLTGPGCIQNCKERCVWKM